MRRADAEHHDRPDAYHSADHAAAPPQAFGTPRWRDQGQEAIGDQEGERRQGGKHIAEQLGSGHREEQHHHRQPEPHQQAQRASARIGQIALPERPVQPRQPRHAEQQQDGRIEPDGLNVVESAASETLELLDHEEVVQKVGEVRLHCNEPGCRQHQEHPRSRQRKKRPQHAPPLHRRQPAQDHQRRDHGADEALRQHPECCRGVGGQQRIAMRQAVFDAQGRMREQQNGRADAARDQHVEVRKLAADVEQRLQQQDQQRQARGPVPGPSPHEQVQPERPEPCAQDGRGAGRPLVQAEQGQRTRRDPVEERWLVKERQPAERGREPVTGAQHFPGDGDVAPLVGQRQRPGPCRRGQPQENQACDTGCVAPARMGSRGHRRTAFKPRPICCRITNHGRAFASSKMRSATSAPSCLNALSSRRSSRTASTTSAASSPCRTKVRISAREAWTTSGSRSRFMQSFKCIGVR